MDMEMEIELMEQQWKLPVNFMRTTRFDGKHMLSFLDQCILLRTRR